ncbi:MAG: hypothetical protein ACOCP8_03885 [archaeon]
MTKNKTKSKEEKIMDEIESFKGYEWKCNHCGKIIINYDKGGVLQEALNHLEFVCKSDEYSEEK